VYTNNVTQCSVESSLKPGMVIRKTMFDFSTFERWLEEAHNGLLAFAQRRNEPGNYERRGRRARPPPPSGPDRVGLSCSPNRRQNEDESGDEACVFANAAGTSLYKAIFGVRQPGGTSSSQMKLTFYARESAYCSSLVVTVFLFSHAQLIRPRTIRRRRFRMAAARSSTSGTCGRCWPARSRCARARRSSVRFTSGICDTRVRRERGNSRTLE
jgi:hypothetical protein